MSDEIVKRMKMYRWERPDQMSVEEMKREGIGMADLHSDCWEIYWQSLRAEELWCLRMPNQSQWGHYLLYHIQGSEADPTETNNIFMKSHL